MEAVEKQRHLIHHLREEIFFPVELWARLPPRFRLPVLLEELKSASLPAESDKHIRILLLTWHQQAGHTKHSCHTHTLAFCFSMTTHLAVVFHVYFKNQLLCIQMSKTSYHFFKHHASHFKTVNKPNSVILLQKPFLVRGYGAFVVGNNGMIQADAIRLHSSHKISRPDRFNLAREGT
jgi:hypothetical protein